MYICTLSYFYISDLLNFGYIAKQLNFFMKKPRLSSAQILSMSMGFLGIQMGFGLQNANASRILQTFGANVDHLSWFWIVAPLTGMIIQPIIGHYSDQTWNRLGRRRPYFLVGAILTALALILMPNAGIFSAFLPAVFVGAGFFMLMDASINVTMEPFRALVADMLPQEQTTVGFSVQTFLIGIGAVIGSWLPYMLLHWFHVGEGTTSSGLPLNVVYAFYCGAAILMITILWTVIRTKEYSPEELKNFQDDSDETPVKTPPASEGYKAEESKATPKAKLSDIFSDIRHMPKTMRQLGLVQFFSWIALFGMWVYTTPAVAETVYHTLDAQSQAFQQAGDWVGIIFGVYNFVAMLFALLLIPMAKKFGQVPTHFTCLTLGGLSLLAMPWITTPLGLIFPMIGIGIAWASILAIPYAILAPTLPLHKVGIYMGIFNFFITLPQIINALFSGLVLKYAFHNHAMPMLTISGIFLIMAALFTLGIKTHSTQTQNVKR